MEKLILATKFIYLPVVNYSMQQNKVPLIRELIVENLSDINLNDLKISLQTDPGFAEFTPYVLSTLPQKQSIRIELDKPVLHTSFFFQMTERITGSLKLNIQQGDELLFEEQYPIDVLAFDQWSGTSVLPELLSSFVIPNHPLITSIIKRASVFLNQWTGNPSLDEYQSRNPNRVKQQVTAVYSAISEQNITYASVPASFENAGQRIRLVDQVLTDKIGNCLEMSLLMASCLEAIGIHPLIIIVKGHAFAGAWISPETYPDNIIEDITFINKRISEGINDIVLLESTCMNQGSASEFDKAAELASAKLKEPDNFILSVDVKRTRFSGIRPLPQRIMGETGWILSEIEKVEEKDFCKPTDVSPYDLTGIENNTSIITKQSLWERKLLDLSLRNNLLNTRITKNTLQLISVDLHKFEDAMADGEEFLIMPKPKDWENPLYDAGIYQSIGETDPIIDLIRSELTQKRLRSYFNEIDLNKSLQGLYKSSRLSLEENGANTLYLALGFLKWFESPVSERARFAPILLMPVEIIRKSAAKGYVVRSREEDTLMNITLLEMLRMNFNITIPGLDPLPTDNSGLDVNKIFAIIRKGIMNQKRWDVEEQAVLGIFSFNKFIMWNDIHNNMDMLMRSNMVSSLVNGKLEWEATSQMIDASELDKSLSPQDIVLPIHADSSQLEAIYEGVNNKTFILHGPPGTGKSQTITNIIANALYKDKRVLFVAEKMAALSVVQSRLKAIGLDPFCLELHSNKSKKTTVLAQLKANTEVIKHQSPQSFKEDAARLYELRSQLNEYIDALHKKYSFGISLYEAITYYLSVENVSEFSISMDTIATLDSHQYKKLQDLADEIASLGKTYGSPHNHPLQEFQLNSYSIQFKEQLIQALEENLKVMEKLHRDAIVVKDILGIDASQLNLDDLLGISQVFQNLLKVPELRPDLLTMTSLVDQLTEFRKIVLIGQKRDQLSDVVQKSFIKDILNLEAAVLLNEWNHVSVKWFMPKWLGQNKITKQLKVFTKQGKINRQEIPIILQQIIDYKNQREEVAKYSDLFACCFGQYGKNESENWETIEQIISATLNIHQQLLLVAKDTEKFTSLKSSLSVKLSDGIHSFKSINQTRIESFIKSLEQCLVASENVYKEVNITTSSISDLSPDWMEKKHKQLENWSANIDRLKDRYLWQEMADKCQKEGMSIMFEHYRDQQIDAAQLPAVFEKSISKASINYILSQNPQLELFQGSLFNDVIVKYRRISKEFIELTTKELYAQLAANIPDFSKEASQNSEVGILQKNIRNNGRGMSIRKILDLIPTLLSRMCPCMLMSPISVAQYIDPKSEPFDLVIFDEASQMPTYEAVGAIARAKNVIVVGDPKQMPPTSFFSNNTVDEDNLEMEDLESILDDCLALSIPSKYLLWHYRSKHESLISFSNSEFYDNKLLTFPSPDNIESKVHLVKIDGFYDKGKSRQNKAEAQAVVDEIARRLRAMELRKRSIGVVTFSVVQQALIEDLLSELFIFQPDLEAYALESEEPLFVKNLENVQGDERDVILFSVGYGPDAEGKVSVNFGPLNRTGGERRLNVAVSRARYEMKIFSTLTADMIDLNRTSSVGVAGLKRFLNFAEKGEKASQPKQVNNIQVCSIDQLIANELTILGYEAHTQIGCSGYRVDVGIVDPDNPNRYILGILCDGEIYRQTKTARDREIVQYSVLELLGWNVIKVWTMDWWENSTEVIQRITKTIEQIKTDGYFRSEVPKTEQKKLITEEPILIQNLSSSANNITAETNEYVTSYQFADLAPSTVNPEFFAFENYKAFIRNQLSNVIEVEAPIQKNLLFKRILASWGIGRLGTRLEAHLSLLLSSVPHYQSGNTIWIDQDQYKSYKQYRINSKRDALDIPTTEIVNAIAQVIKEQISLPTDDLIRQAAVLLGFSHIGTNVDDSIRNGLKEAIKSNIVKVDETKASIV
jgi:superfamily I DNA and/or RNA helicase/very-short-patch-repair endonuclease